MKPIRLLVGSAVVVLVLAFALLEMMADRVRFEPRSGASDPHQEGGDRWQDALGTQRGGGWDMGDVSGASLASRRGGEGHDR
jgi:hypothetical protein